MAAPIDPRLLAAAPAAKRALIVTGLVQGLDTVLIVVRGVLLGTAVATMITEHRAQWSLVASVAVVCLAQALVAGIRRRWASISAGAVVDDLRASAVRALDTKDPREVEADAAHWRTVLGPGLAGVRPYFSDYIPALLACCIATPATLATIYYFDRTSGLLAAVTIPLIPIFMILIGKLTQANTEKRLKVTGILSAQMSDLLMGAATLRALGATQVPKQQLRSTGTKHANSTMSVLRLAFLSAFALEFLATLSVALVAVSIGLRLVRGDMTLLAGLVSLIIVPEVYTPLRRVGASFHAAVDGMTATEEVFELVATTRSLDAPYLIESMDNSVCARDLSISGRDGVRPAALSFHAEPGAVTALAGENGAGKSTTLLALLGAIPGSAVSGSISAPSRVDYLPARPALIGASVAENIELFGPRSHAEVGIDFPLDQAIRPDGTDISAGQGQRIGLARALGGVAPVVLLDEPTAHLDPELKPVIITAIRARARAGATVIVATHDPLLLAAADRVVVL